LTVFAARYLMKREPRSGRGIHAHRHDRVLFGGMLDDLAAESVRPEAGDGAGIGAMESPATVLLMRCSLREGGCMMRHGCDGSA
jgi:hypothetical protein